MSDFPKRMIVWNDENSLKYKRTVLGVTDGGRAVCVIESYKYDYEEGNSFKTQVWDHYKELPKKRMMTRIEVMGFIQNTSGIVARPKGSGSTWDFPDNPTYVNSSVNYEWATIDADGNIGEPQEFEK